MLGTNVNNLHFRSAAETRAVRNVPKFLFGVWIVYLLLSPFYVLHSGLPQPADVTLLLGIIPAMFFISTNPKTRLDLTYLVGFSFAILTVVINGIYFLFYNEPKLMFASMFYFYNFLVFCFVVFLFQISPKLMNYGTYLAIAAIIIVQFIIVYFVDTAGVRHEGTFNNPNQLAYWSLLMGAMLIVLKRSSSLNLLDMALFSMLAYIQTQSLSKAGLITFGLLVLLMAFSPVANKKLKAIFLMLLCVFTITKVTAPVETQLIITAADNIEAVTQRLGEIGVDRDDSALGRGYGRLLEYPAYLLGGAGEGAHWRFNARQELHSGIATILFSYGILGFTLFGLFVVLVFRHAPLYYGVLMIPIVLYGLTHQNFRNTGFWIFLALCYSYTYFKKATEGERAQKKNHRLDFFIKDSETAGR